MICTKCNKIELTPIWYGKPTYEKIMLAQLDQIVLGGLIKKPYTHYCNFCQDTYPTSEDLDKGYDF
jgi:hypothetical protein